MSRETFCFDLGLDRDRPDRGRLRRRLLVVFRCVVTYFISSGFVIDMCVAVALLIEEDAFRSRTNQEGFCGTGWRVRAVEGRRRRNTKKSRVREPPCAIYI